MKGIPRSHMGSDMKMYLLYSAVVWGVLIIIEVREQLTSWKQLRKLNGVLIMSLFSMLGKSDVGNNRDAIIHFKITATAVRLLIS